MRAEDDLASVFSLAVKYSGMRSKESAVRYPGHTRTASMFPDFEPLPAHPAAAKAVNITRAEKMETRRRLMNLFFGTDYPARRSRN
jgi:hypothetical protein